jgi:hypothetical protein
MATKIAEERELSALLAEYADHINHLEWAMERLREQNILYSDLRRSIAALGDRDPAVIGARLKKWRQRAKSFYGSTKKWEGHHARDHNEYCPGKDAHGHYARQTRKRGRKEIRREKVQEEASSV